MTIPISLNVVAKWAPPMERATMSTYASSGLMLGITVSNALTGWLMEVTKNWHYVFYLYGSLSVLWLIFWVKLNLKLYNK